MDGPCGEPLYIKVQITDHVPGEANRIALVVDAEARWKTDPVGIAAKDPDTCRVKGGDPHPVCDRADEGCDTLLHLGSRLVGEGDGEDPEG